MDPLADGRRDDSDRIDLLGRLAHAATETRLPHSPAHAPRAREGAHSERTDGRPRTHALGDGSSRRGR